MLLISTTMLVSCGPVRNYDDPYEPFYEGHYAGDVPNLGETIKIVTWNLSFAENIDTAIEALTLVDELKNADVLLLQEMDEIGVERLAQDLGYNYVYYPATIHPRHNKKFGNAVLTKWEIVEHDKILLPKSGSDRKHTRNAVRAVIRIAGQEISAYSVHLETFWVFQIREKRQAAFLNNQIEEDKNIVVGGDFNSLTRGSILYLEQIMDQAGLRRLSKNTGYSFEYKGIKLTLDHIFGSGIEYYDSGVWRGSDASDHHPIWSQIRLQ